VSKSENKVLAFDKDLCFIDIETTGTIFGYHEIIEIAIIRTCPAGEDIRFRWAQKVAPLFPERITPAAQSINGFRPDEWPQETASTAFWQHVATMFAGGLPVCHNPSFERAFISLATGQHGVSDLRLDHHWIGTESLAWPLVKQIHLERYSLEGICQYLGIPCEPMPHSALGGADACLRVYLQLMHLHQKIPAPAVASHM
jgi:DNA polymerase III epsilon subunit-like protein